VTTPRDPALELLPYETPLHPYQIEGSKWLRPRQTALLADEMGLGKSVQAISASEHRDRVLVVCPRVALINWKREFAKWSRSSRKTHILTSAKCVQTTMADLDWHGSVLAITTYGVIRNSYKLLAERTWDVLILDEAHSVKSAEAAQSKAVWGKGGLISSAARRWLLTGTPITNHPGDLWPLLYCTGRTKLKHEAFLKEFCNTYTFQGQLCVRGAKASKADALRELLSEVMLRRTKDQVGLQLPPIDYQDVTVEAGPVNVEDLGVQWVFPLDRTQELTEKLAEERFKVQTTLVDGITLKGLEALAKSVATLRRWTGLQKVHPVAELVRSELDAGMYDKIVLFGEHRAVIEGLREKLKDFGAVTLYGGTKDPQKAIDRFRESGACRVFIANLQAASTAIDLTSAHQAIIVEPPWTPSTIDQACGRLHRLTQPLPVTVRFAVLDDSCDQAVIRLLKRKSADCRKILAQKV